MSCFLCWACKSENALQLDYTPFDQTPGKGWRALSEQGRFHEAATLIDQYGKAHPDLPDHQMKMLLYHAGQLYAFDNDFQPAIKRLEEALYEQESTIFHWNARVNATIAFLNHDLGKLRQNRAIIAEGPWFNQKPPNTTYVDQLIKDFGKPYRDIDPTAWGDKPLPPRRDP